MGKTLIKIDCIDQRLLVSSGPPIASGGRNEDEIEFNFCSLWDEFEKTAVFYRERNAVYHAAIVGNRCVIPHEVLADEGWMYFGVFGVKGDITRTSEIMRYRVIEGAITEGTKPSDPTPDIYAQFVNRIVALENRATALEAFTVSPTAYEINGSLVQLDNFEGMPMNVVSHLEPIQSGSGDPYPAGCGAQLFDVGSITSADVAVDGDDWITLELDNSSGTSAAYKSAYTPTSARLIEGKKYVVVTEIKEITARELIVVGDATSTNKSQFIDSVWYTTPGTNVKVITARDNFSDCVTMLRTNMAVSAGQIGKVVFRVSVLEDTTVTAGTFTYKPYANIRAITGRTSTKLTRCGKNLYDLNSASTISTNKIEINGSAIRLYTTQAAVYASTVGNTIRLKAGVRYTLSGKVTAIGIQSRWARLCVRRKASAQIISATSIDIAAGVGSYSRAFTLNEDVDVYVSVLVTGSTAEMGDMTLADIMLEESSSATNYEPYQGGSFSLSFGQTVYGCKADWNKGELAVDWALMTLDGSEGWYSRASAGGRYRAQIENYNIGYLPPVDNTVAADAICSHYPSRSGNNTHDGVMGFTLERTDGHMSFYDPMRTVQDISVWKAYLTAQKAAGTPVQIAYKLKNPTVIQLTPQQITALAGVNTLYGDTEITVSGRKDILWLTDYLMQRIHELESAVVSLGGNV